ncbi:MAG: hypothetical protein M1812_004511 [Candelaria pacifica]|nr:MAG: hypothetical protein M1812_004511 [Candelaria pacifica]
MTHRWAYGTMTGVPIHTDSPINPAKAEGVTPQTATPRTQGTYPTAPVPNPAPATTTASATSSNGYTPARPGAPSMPAPTGSTQRSAHAPQPSPTRTTAVENEGPPPPQPGAFPTPSVGASEVRRPSIPPPPKASETPKASLQANPPTATSVSTPKKPQPYPPQMTIPPPTFANSAQPLGSATSSSTNTSPSRSHPISLPTPFSEQSPTFQQRPTPTSTTSTNFTSPLENTNTSPTAPHSRQSLDHPPGYQQNPYAPDMPPSARLAQESAESSPNKERLPGLGYGHGRKGSVLDTGTEDNGEGGIWDTAKKWAVMAGEKASEVEGEVWRRINKE